MAHNAEHASFDQDQELPPDSEWSGRSSGETLPETGPETPVPPKPRSGAWLGYLTLAMVVLLSAGGYFLLHAFRSELGANLSKEDQQVGELTRQIGSLQQQLAALHNQVAGLQGQLITEDSKIERVLGEQSSSYAERLELTKTELNKSVENIQRQLSRSRGDVLVADAEYLLSIANQKLHLIGDIKGVLAAMEAADQRLHDSGDPGVFAVREALAEEINLLKNLTPVDAVGLSAKILALEGKIREIPLFMPHTPTSGEPLTNPKEPPEQPPGEQAEPVPEGMIDSALERLKDLVTVRRTDRPIQAILTPEEVEGLRQILLLKLEMARASLLRGDETMYQANLSSAHDFLQANFDREAQATQDMMAELTKLMEQKIRIPMPDVSKSLSLIRNIERLRLKAEQQQQPLKEQPPKPQESGSQQ